MLPTAEAGRATPGLFSEKSHPTSCWDAQYSHKSIFHHPSLHLQEFEVLLRKTTSDGLSEMACSTVHIESHDSCKCGCDVEAAQCSDLQASYYLTFHTWRK